MKIFKHTREKLGYSVLAFKAGKLIRDKKAVNIHHAQNVGILFSVDTKERYEEKKEFLNYLKEKGLQMTVLVYLKNPEISKLGNNSKINTFSQEDLGWNFLPKSAIVNDFIHQPYDIFINLNKQADLQTSYITGLSKAHFKVGLNNDARKYLDLILDIHDREDFSYFSGQLKHYLTVINQTA